jgi:hypothetical protein
MAEINPTSGRHQADTIAVLDSMLADITAIRAEVVKLVTDMGTRITEHNTLATKLNADAGVTDTNYAAAAAITAAAPAALTTTT